MYITVQNGVARDHGRCTCPDCNTKYATHNKYERCLCGECAQYRETGYHEPPAVTRPENIPAFWRTPEATSYIRAPERKEDPVSTIHICTREGCESLVVGKALTRLTLELNPLSIQDSAAGHDILGDLCARCAEDIDKLLHTPPIDPRPKKQDQPYKGWNDFAEDDAVLQASDDQLLAELLRRNMRTRAIEQ